MAEGIGNALYPGQRLVKSIKPIDKRGKIDKAALVLWGIDLEEAIAALYCQTGMHQQKTREGKKREKTSKIEVKVKVKWRKYLQKQ